VKKVDADFSLIQKGNESEDEKSRIGLHLTKAATALNTVKKDSNGKKKPPTAKVPELLAIFNASGTRHTQLLAQAKEGDQEVEKGNERYSMKWNLRKTLEHLRSLHCNTYNTIDRKQT